MENGITRITIHLIDGTEKYIENKDLHLWLNYLKQTTLVAEEQKVIFPWEQIVWKNAIEEIFY